MEYLKRTPLALRKYRLYIPEEILSVYGLSLRNLWDRNLGVPQDDFYDCVLEFSLLSYLRTAAFCKLHLEKAKELSSSLPKESFRAFLLAVEVEYFLERLEKNDFNVFRPEVLGKSYFILPYRMQRAARKGQFYYKD